MGKKGQLKQLEDRGGSTGPDRAQKLAAAFSKERPRSPGRHDAASEESAAKASAGEDLGDAGEERRLYRCSVTEKIAKAAQRLSNVDIYLPSFCDVGEVSSIGSNEGSDKDEKPANEPYNHEDVDRKILKNMENFLEFQHKTIYA